MTNLRIERRMNPPVLADKDLLPSQRMLFDITSSELDPNRASRSHLPAQAINRLGEVLAYDVALMIDASHAESGRSPSDLKRTQLHLGHMARNLLEYDPHRDPYEGYDRRQVVIRESTRVETYIQDGYDVFGADGKPGFNGRVRFFTPEGYVDNPVGDFKQKLVTFDIKNVSTFAEDIFVNFSTRSQLRIYTNNLAAQTPRWEYLEGDGLGSDMLPGHSSNPYFLHLSPNPVASEELAEAVVGSLARIINEE